MLSNISYRSFGGEEVYIVMVAAVWFIAWPVHQHPWYWLCRVCKFLSYTRKDSTTCVMWRNDIKIDEFLCFPRTWWSHLRQNIFRFTGHLCGEFTGHRWIPHTKASYAELWCFLRLKKLLSKPWWGWWFETPSRPLWRHCDDVFIFPFQRVTSRTSCVTCRSRSSRTLSATLSTPSWTSTSSSPSQRTWSVLASESAAGTHAR